MINSPKILLISNMYPSESEPGFGIFVKNIYTQIKNNNFCIEKIVIDKKNVSSVRKFKLYLSLYFKVVLSLSKYDVFYIHFISHTSLPFVLLNHLGFDFNLISHVHGGDIKLLNGFNSFQFRLKKYIVRRTLIVSNKIIVPSKSYGDYLIKHYDVAQEKIVIYPSGGVNMSIFKTDGSIQVIKGLVGYAGRLIKSKNVDLIIRSIVNIPAVRLEILGDGPEKANLLNLVSDLRLNDRVMFYPSASQVDLAKWYNKIDVLVYPSDSESLGLVPIEAICCNTKVVLSKIPAFEELSLNNIDVAFPDKQDVDSYSDAIKEMINMPDTQSKLVFESNLARVKEIYSSESTIERLLNAF